MDILISIMQFFFWNEFPFQLFFALLLFVPWKRGRSYLPIRLLATFAALFLVYLLIPIPRPTIFMVEYIMLIIAMPIVFKCNFWESLFFASNAYCVQNVISSIVYALLWRQFLPVTFMQDVFWVNLMFNAYAISIVVSLIAYVIVFFAYTLRYINIERFKMHNLVLIFISAVVGVFAIYFVSFCLGEEFTVSSQSNYRVLTATISFLCLLVNVSNCERKTMETENKILRLLLKKDEQQYEQAKRSMEKVNIKYHDLKKAQASDYAQSMNLCDTNVDEIDYGFMTGNKTLDIVLFEKNSICRQKGIRFACEADGKVLDNMKPYHIYSLFGNVLDNAIESLEKLQDEKMKELFLSVIRRGNIAIIKCYNYTQNVLHQVDGFPTTTKSEREEHGYGMKSISSVAETYNGSVNYFIENQIFYLVITLPIE